MTKDILLIMPALFIGGAEKQYRYIADALSEDNNVTVLLLNRPLEGQEKQTLNYIEHHRNIKYYQLLYKSIVFAQIHCNNYISIDYNCRLVFMVVPQYRAWGFRWQCN